jgi:hypothetical protein
MRSEIKPQEEETTRHEDTRVASWRTSHGLYILQLKNTKGTKRL